MGHKNVVLYQEGLEGWGKKGLPFTSLEKIPTVELKFLSAVDLSKLIAEKGKSLLLIDVRDDELYQAIQLKGGEVTHVRMVDLQDKKDSLPKDKELVIVDQLGKQVVPAGSLLLSWGYKVIGVLDGGIMGWQKDGLPVDMPKANP